MPFSPAALRFFRQLSSHNDKAWFEAHRDHYEQDVHYQSFVSGRSLTDALVTSSKLPSLLAREYEALLPLVRWLNGSLGLKPAEKR
jgi:uncharacterized protein (DUF2461 family)